MESKTKPRILTPRELSADDVADALSYVSSDERETWVACGMAVSEHLGDAGWPIWLAWSEQSARFKLSAAQAVWRSFRTGGGVGIGTLVKIAREGGWRPGDDTQRHSWMDTARRASDITAKEPVPHRTVVDPEEFDGQLRTALTELEPVVDAPYMVRKGLKDQFCMVDKQGRIVVAIRDINSGDISAVQYIYEDGRKQFYPPGCRVAGRAFVIGRYARTGQSETWWCEGWATGLSIQRALNLIYRPADTVVICFSAGNLRKLATHGIVIADHDWWHCQRGHKWENATLSRRCPECGGKASMPAGEQAALATGCQWWQPPDAGTDANDYMLSHGIDALAATLRELKANRPIIGPVPVIPAPLSGTQRRDGSGVQGGHRGILP